MGYQRTCSKHQHVLKVIKMKCNKIKYALSCHKEGFNCSQAIFSAYAQELGLDKKTTLKVAGAFGGGMARMGETCGAVTGVFMILGFKYGQIKANNKDAKEKTYKIAKKFISNFKKRNRSILCKELLGYDINTPAGRKIIREKGLHDTLCSKFIKDAIEITEKILTNN